MGLLLLLRQRLPALNGLMQRFGVSSITRHGYQLIALTAVVVTGTGGAAGLAALHQHSQPADTGREQAAARAKPARPSPALMMGQQPGKSASDQNKTTKGVSSTLNVSNSVEMNSSNGAVDSHVSVSINGRKISVPQDQSFSKRINSDGGHASVSIVRNSSQDGSSTSMNLDVTNIQEGSSE